MKFPIVFRQKAADYALFFMADENTNIIPDLTDADEVRKAIIVSEVLNRKY